MRTEREVQGGNKRKVEREQGKRRERDGEMEEGAARRENNKSKEGEMEGRWRKTGRTGVCRARSFGRGARDQRADPGAPATSARRPLLGGLGVRLRGSGARLGGGTGGGDGAAAAGAG